MSSLRWLAAGILAAGALTVPAGTTLAADHTASRALESFTVSNTNGETKTAKVVAGHSYKIVASGTISDWCAPSAKQASDCTYGSPLAISQGVDALYCYATWRCPKRLLWRHLAVNGLGLDALVGMPGKVPYSASHTYTVVYEADENETLQFHSIDTSTSDNSGKFSVAITDLGLTESLRPHSAPTSSVTVNFQRPVGFARTEATLRNGGTFRLCNRLNRIEVFFGRGDDKDVLFRSPEIDLRLSPGKCVVRTLRNPTKKPYLIRIYAQASSDLKEEGFELTLLP